MLDERRLGLASVWQNELRVDHYGNAVVKTLTVILDALEPHGSEADRT
jgi:hypothetical protein